MIWSHPGNDVTGMVPRCEKVATTCEKVSNPINCLLAQKIVFGND